MKKPTWKRANAIAASVIVLGMTLAPGIASAHSKHDHGTDWNLTFNANGRGSFTFQYQGSHGKHDGHDGNGDNGGMGDQGGMGNEHGGGHGKLGNVQALLQQLQKAVAYFNPLVQADEQKVQTDLQAAQTASAASGTTGASVTTTSELSIEKDMQSILTQMASVSSQQQLLTLTQQLKADIEKLHDSAQTAIGDDQEEDGSLHSYTEQIKELEDRYTQVYNAAMSLLNAVTSSGASTSDTTGGAREENYGRVREVLQRYKAVSLQAIRMLERIDLQLSSSASGQGSTTQSTVSAQNSTVVVPSGSIVAGQHLTVTGAVYDTNDQAVASTPVTVNFDGQSITATTAASGSYSATLTPTAAVTSGPVVVSAGGVTISTAAEVATVTAATPTQLQSNVASSAYVFVGPSSAQTITYKLLDAYGNPVPNATIDFSLKQVVGPTTETANESSEAMGTLSAASGTTGANGQVSVTYTSSSTADTDGDLEDIVTASLAANSAVSNSQAQYLY